MSNDDHGYLASGVFSIDEAFRTDPRSQTPDGLCAMIMERTKLPLDAAAALGVRLMKATAMPVPGMEARYQAFLETLEEMAGTAAVVEFETRKPGGAGPTMH